MENNVLIKKILRNDLINFYLLILFTIGVIYYLKVAFLILMYFIILGIISYKSKKDYYWLAFALFTYDWVGSLFHLNFSQEIISGLKIGFMEIYSIVLVLKFHKRLLFQQFVFRKPIKIIIFYGIFLIILGFVYGIKRSDTSGQGLGTYVSIFRMILWAPLFYTVPYILSNNKRLIGFLTFVFSFVFINILAQFYEILNHKTIHLALGAEYIGETGYFERDYIRPMAGIFSSLLTLFFAWYILTTKKIKVFSDGYLYLVIIISIISIFITATRGWIIAIAFFLLFQILAINQKSIKIVFMLLVFSVGSYLIVPTVKNQMDFVYNRLLTLEALAKGDLEMEGTNARLTTRSIPVIEKFKEKQIFGWGYSGIGVKTHDVHVGNQSVLMSGGIVGFAIVLFLQFYIILKIYNIVGLSKKNGGLVLIFIVMTLFIIHSSSSQYYGWLIYAHGMHRVKILYLAIFFGIINSFLINRYSNRTSITAVFKDKNGIANK